MIRKHKHKHPSSPRTRWIDGTDLKTAYDVLLDAKPHKGHAWHSPLGVSGLKKQARYSATEKHCPTSFNVLVFHVHYIGSILFQT